MDQFRNQPRLPKFAVPKRYEISLKPDLCLCKFSGSVAIDVDILSDTRFLVLNAADLHVDDASVSFKHRSSSKVLNRSLFMTWDSTLGAFEDCKEKSGRMKGNDVDFFF